MEQRIDNARALLAICELMQCKLLSPDTVAYLAQVRDMLHAELNAGVDADEAISA